ncbi:hypothetical protein VpaJT1_23 [Vibrio phage VpaJT_1]|nr:hypothetical protein VpaJT1_23 [Vibrio phage VpaJT_1]
MYPVKIEKVGENLHRIKRGDEKDFDILSPIKVSSTNCVVYSPDPNYVILELYQLGGGNLDSWDFIRAVVATFEGLNSSISKAYDSYVTWCALFSKQAIARKIFDVWVRRGYQDFSENTTSPNDALVGEFLNDHCIVDDGKRVHCKDLYDKFCRTSKQNIAYNDFIYSVRSKLEPEGVVKGPTMIKGVQLQGFKGVGLL